MLPAMVDDLIDSHVSIAQCQRAVEALHAHESKKEPEKEQYIWLNVNIKSFSPTHKFKPCRIPVVHPLVDPRTSSVCLITKDPQQQYKDLLQSNGVKFIENVVGLGKLKGKLKDNNARLALLEQFGLFLADERIVPLLPKILGSKFFAAKKQPIPVCLTKKNLKSELERAVTSTYMNQNQGTCVSIKVARLTHGPSQILDNIKSAIPSIVKNIKGGWDNIQSFHIKTSNSASLPLWNCPSDEWNGLEEEEESPIKIDFKELVSSITKAELQQKRSSASGERKKEKVVKSKGGSAKKGVLGKRTI